MFSLVVFLIFFLLPPTQEIAFVMRMNAELDAIDPTYRRCCGSSYGTRRCPSLSATDILLRVAIPILFILVASIAFKSAAAGSGSESIMTAVAEVAYARSFAQLRSNIQQAAAEGNSTAAENVFDKARLELLATFASVLTTTVDNSTISGLAIISTVILGLLIILIVWEPIKAIMCCMCR